MIKSNSDTIKNIPKTRAKRPKPMKKAERNKTVGFCVYIGPTIIGEIQSGTIFSGNKAEVLDSLKDIIQKYPQISALIVTGDTLSEARIKVITPGNWLYVKYCQLISELKTRRKL